MCCPFVFSASCGGGDDSTTITFSKVILSAEETKTYQTPWEFQQKELREKKRMCMCWCCVCMCKPVSNRKKRRVSTNKMERRAISYKNLIYTVKPSVEKIKKWENSFEAVLSDKDGRLLFDTFLQQEHSDENLQFWCEVDHLSSLVKDQEKREKMMFIYFEFLRPMASREVNVSSTIRKKIEEDLSHNPADATIFNDAQHQVELMMYRQSYPRFLVSDLFNTVSQSAYANKVTTS